MIRIASKHFAQYAISFSLTAVCILIVGHTALAQSADPIAKESLEKSNVSRIEIMPHRALYEIKLTSLRSGAQINNLYGEMFFELRKDCDAWVSDHRSNLFYEYTEGGAVNITTDFSTYEPFDGQTMSFNTRREQGGRLLEEFRGYVEKTEQGAHQATYTLPEGLNHTLHADTLFPLQHTKDILEKADKGERFFNATIFDGSDDEGPQNVNVFIGDTQNPQTISLAADSERISKDLLNTRNWYLRMAYYPNTQKSESAKYEMSLTAHENGVVSFAHIDYDKFSIEQKLVALEPLEPTSCQ